MKIIKLYPVGVLSVSLLVNFIFGIQPYSITVPSLEIIEALIIGTVLLIINHTWLMTTTELVRTRFNLLATPEELIKSSASMSVSSEGISELERRHNAHRNTTENVVYFSLLSMAFMFATPATSIALIWLIGFGVARLGYTYSYLTYNTNMRGVFMSLTLLCMYGLASYLLISLVL